MENRTQCINGNINQFTLVFRLKEKSKSKPKTKSTDNKKKGLPYWIEVNVGKSGWITGNKKIKIKYFLREIVVIEKFSKLKSVTILSN